MRDTWPPYKACHNYNPSQDRSLTATCVFNTEPRALKAPEDVRGGVASEKMRWLRGWVCPKYARLRVKHRCDSDFSFVFSPSGWPRIHTHRRCLAERQLLKSSLVNLRGWSVLTLLRFRGELIISPSWRIDMPARTHKLTSKSPKLSQIHTDSTWI